MLGDEFSPIEWVVIIGISALACLVIGLCVYLSV